MLASFEFGHTKGGRHDVAKVRLSSPTTMRRTIFHPHQDSLQSHPVTLFSIVCEGRVVRCWHTSTALNVVGDRNCRICIIAGGFEMQIMASISIITINRPSPDQELGIDDDLSQHGNVTRGATKTIAPPPSVQHERDGEKVFNLANFRVPQ